VSIYLLVHNNKLVWTRSGNRLAMYDTLDKAKAWRSYHTTDYTRVGDEYVKNPDNPADHILEITLGDIPSARYVEEG